MCSMFRDPRREDHTTWTAVAPDEVFTVRTYTTTGDYEPWPSAQLRRPQPLNQQATALTLGRPGSSDKSQVLAGYRCPAVFADQPAETFLRSIRVAMSTTRPG
jgi:hypothetical protein